MEEFGPTFVYLKGSDNNLADALSRLDTGHSVAHTFCYLEVDDVIFKPEGDVAQAEMFNSLVEEEIPQHVFPMSTHVIAAEQRKDMQLFKLLQTNPAYFTRKVEGVELIHMEGKIYVPTRLRKQILTWYHEFLVHPGQKRLELTVRQHLTWPGLTADVKNLVATCHSCKTCKTT